MSKDYTGSLYNLHDQVGECIRELNKSKERLRRALIAYGVPIPLEGGTLGEWAAMIEGALIMRLGSDSYDKLIEQMDRMEVVAHE